jgi:hypothetical protein
MKWKKKRKERKRRRSKKRRKEEEVGEGMKVDVKKNIKR